MKYVFLRYGDSPDFDQVVIVLGSLFTRAKQDVINQVLKRELKEHSQKPFQIYFHDGRADINSQIADYCCWAIYRELEDGERRPLNAIKARVAPSFDMFRTGTTEYYKDPKVDHPAYPIGEEPGGSCRRGGTFAAFSIDGRSDI